MAASLLAMLIFALPAPMKSQDSARKLSEQPTTGIQSLANGLAVQIAKSGRAKVLVVDIKIPSGEWMPFSAWLADQFSSALAGAGQQLDIIDRSQLAEYVKSHNVSPQEMFESATARELGKQIGAIIVVRGALGPAENGFGISLNAFTVSPPKRKKTNQSLGEVHGKIPMSAAISEHVGVPIEDLFPKDGVYQANEGGIGFPMCLYCPRPQFSPELMQRKIRGVVTLEAVITSEGKATQIRVTKSVERQFDREVIRAVETWSFKPAVDIDGRPTNVRQPIEIVMHPY